MLREIRMEQLSIEGVPANPGLYMTTTLARDYPDDITYRGSKAMPYQGFRGASAGSAAGRCRAVDGGGGGSLLRTRLGKWSSESQVFGTPTGSWTLFPKWSPI
jgi:hypothetical protein